MNNTFLTVENGLYVSTDYIATILKSLVIDPKNLESLGYPTGGVNGIAEIYIPETPFNTSVKDSSESDIFLRRCARCRSVFQQTSDLLYVQNDHCLYHWGRESKSGYSCCKQESGSTGCCSAPLHVWSGLTPGQREYRKGFVKTTLNHGGMYALDVESCYTVRGLEATQVAVIDSNGQLVYLELVKPDYPIVDHNTRFSGLNEETMLCASKTLSEVQEDLLQFIGSDTILVGHALDNDLRALKIVHNLVIDTSVIFPHPLGLPWRPSLRSLALLYLGTSIQRGAHCPTEDALTSLRLAYHAIHERLNPFRGS